jgi:YVTN family beta-propeller protein
VYIVNEGNFQFGNAKVSYYDIASGSAVEDLYGPANGVALGDVCQSMRLFNGKGYVVVNNSGKVVVVDPSTFVATATITGFNSPRYFLPVSNSKAYVTDFHANSIAVVDLSSNTITGSIHCPGWTEELVLANGRAYVTNEARDKVYVIDTDVDQITDSITVSMGGNSIVADAHGKLWVMCDGAASTLYRIDPVSVQVEASFAFPNSSDSPWRLSINSGNDTLYYLNGDVYRMAINASALPNTPFITADGRDLYGIGIEPNSGVVYVADAIDYTQRGTIYRYRPDGSLINSFQAGIIPGEFCFQ